MQQRIANFRKGSGSTSAQRWLLVRYMFAAIGLIIPFAMVQHFLVLGIPLEAFNPRLLMVPIAVGSIFGFLLGKIHLLREALSTLNAGLEKTVEERTERLAQSERFTQQILDTQTNVVLLSDLERLVRVNQAFFRLLPQFDSLEAFLQHHTCICELFEQDDVGSYIGSRVQGEPWVSYIDEHPEEQHRVLIGGIIFEVHARHLDTESGRFYVVNMNDITEMVQTKEQLISAGEELRRELYTDHLTGLPNRRSLLDELERSSQSALLLLDIDAFKEINDFFGHDSGDDILCEVGERLRTTIQALGGSVYRLSADEFGVLLEVADEQALGEAAERILYCIESTPFIDRNHSEIAVSLTMGAVMRDQLGEHLPLAAAAVALKCAKQQKRPYLQHNEAFEQHALYARNIAQARLVRWAINNDRIVAYFQPILNLHSGRIDKYEVLARILREDEQVVLPADFLDAAKASKFYPHITRQILLQGLERIATTAANTAFSFNLSIEDILDRDSAEFILQRLEASGLAARCVLEILESEGINNFAEVNDFIRRARALGCQLAIDDFGAGFSNFEYLLRLEVDYLKIDASLIRDLDHDENALIIVRTIQDFARQLGIRTVAEFVHSAEVLKVVEQLGIDYAQGFHIAHPAAEPLLELPEPLCRLSEGA